MGYPYPIFLHMCFLGALEVVRDVPSSLSVVQALQRFMLRDAAGADHSGFLLKSLISVTIVGIYGKSSGVFIMAA